MNIGIDLGGTRIKGILLNEKGEVIDQCIEATNDGEGSPWKDAVKSVVHQLAAKHKLEIIPIGISAPGIPNEDFSAIAFMPGRMQGLENFNWSSHLGFNTLVLNDAVSALVAESKFGAARGHRHAVLITLGTGVGGAIILDGKPFGGVFNKAGHIGHMVIDEQGEKDVTNMPGSLEDCIGNCTIQKRTNGKYDSTKALLDDVKLDDAYANNIWFTSVRRLALGLASIVNILSPEVIVIGGGIAEANDLLFDPLASYLDEFEWRPGGNKVKIVKAQYGELAGAIGAAAFAKEQIQNINI